MNTCLKTCQSRLSWKRNRICHQYVLIEKTGSGETDHIKRATFAIQSYAGSLYSAALLNENVKEVMKNIVDLDEISKCSLNSDYNYTDTGRKKYRYQAVFDIVHY